MVILCIGMIASGKGQFCQMMARRGAIIINDDDVVKACHAGDYTLYRKENKEIYKQIEVAMMLASLAKGRDVVIDRPNFKRSTRRRYIGIAGIYGVPVIAVGFPCETPLEHATRRFTSDPRGLPLEHWIDAANRHFADWETPSLDEGLDNIIPSDVAIQMAANGGL
jgi:predicted kinase